MSSTLREQMIRIFLRTIEQLSVNPRMQVVMQIGAAKLGSAKRFQEVCQIIGILRNCITLTDLIQFRDRLS